MAGFLILLSDEGFRLDGRRPNEHRQIQCKMGVYRQADGSAYIEQGNSKVLATVYGPHEVRGPRRVTYSDQAVINCQYSMAVFSTAERKRRPRGDRRSLEMTRHLEQTFRSAILTSTYPRSQIDIYVETWDPIFKELCNKVVQADGSTFSACVNAASLALVDAGIAMKDIVCSCTAADLGLASGEGSTPIIDANKLEHLCNMVTLTCLPKSEKIVHLETTGRLHQDRLYKLLQAAANGCNELHGILESVVREHVRELASSIESTR